MTTAAVAASLRPDKGLRLDKVFFRFRVALVRRFLLKKLVPIEYVLDPRFEALGCAFIWEGSAFWVDGPDLPDYLSTIDWSNVFAISHNALFDMTVLAWRYGVVPRFYGDTLSMARNWLAHKLSHLVARQSRCALWHASQMGDARADEGDWLRRTLSTPRAA